MSKRIEKAQEIVHNAIETAAEGLDRADYIELIDWLGAEAKSRSDCIREEEAEL